MSPARADWLKGDKLSPTSQRLKGVLKEVEDIRVQLYSLKERLHNAEDAEPDSELLAKVEEYKVDYFPTIKITDEMNNSENQKNTEPLMRQPVMIRPHGYVLIPCHHQNLVIQLKVHPQRHVLNRMKNTVYQICHQDVIRFLLPRLIIYINLEYLI
eukprot:UN28416